MTRKKSIFTQTLMHWHHHTNKREMPWKGETDPYKIWLSEIILQQTRVEQGLSYYLRFLQAYPTVMDLAAAPDSEVFKKWEGLGYYSRCRNLLFTARMVVNTFGGAFPADFGELLKLKGVGPYTAAAIASFAFGLPFAVVDGNVIRVLARVFNIEKPAGGPEGKKYFAELAQCLLDKGSPGAYNQAIMDFGATVCKPAMPACTKCPLSNSCQAYKLGKTNVLPIKKLRLEKKKRYFLYFILRHQDKIWVRERTGKDIWRHLEEFYLVELKGAKELSEKNAVSLLKTMEWPVEANLAFDEKMEQALTHQLITARFVLVDLKAKPDLPKEGHWVPQKRLKEIAFPKTINLFLEKSGYGQPGLFDVWRK